MSILRNRDFLQVLTFLSGLLGVVAGFFAWAAGSDFYARGCGDLPPESWPLTSNCSDAHSVAWAGGWVAVSMLSLLFLSVRRLRHV